MYSRVPSWTSSLGEKLILVSRTASCQPPSRKSRMRLQDRRLQPLDHPFAHQLLSLSRRLDYPAGKIRAFFRIDVMPYQPVGAERRRRTEIYSSGLSRSKPRSVIGSHER